MDDTNLVQGNYYSYDSTLKKLLHIIKSKTSDNIKQLEDLWESINTNNIQQINIVPINNNNKISSRISPARSSSSQSPVHLSESSNDSTNSNSSNVSIDFDSNFYPETINNFNQKVKKRSVKNVFFTGVFSDKKAKNR